MTWLWIRPIHCNLKGILKRVPGGSSHDTLWTLLASWFRDHKHINWHIQNLYCSDTCLLGYLFTPHKQAPYKRELHHFPLTRFNHIRISHIIDRTFCCRSKEREWSLSCSSLLSFLPPLATEAPLHQTPYFSFRQQLFFVLFFQSFFLNPTILYHITHTFGPAQEVSL